MVKHLFHRPDGLPICDCQENRIPSAPKSPIETFASELIGKRSHSWASISELFLPSQIKFRTCSVVLCVESYWTLNSKSMKCKSTHFTLWRRPVNEWNNSKDPVFLCIGTKICSSDCVANCPYTIISYILITPWLLSVVVSWNFQCKFGFCCFKWRAD